MIRTMDPQGPPKDLLASSLDFIASSPLYRSECLSYLFNDRGFKPFYAILQLRWYWKRNRTYQRYGGSEMLTDKTDGNGDRRERGVDHRDLR